MTKLHIAEELAHEDVASIQDETHALGWPVTKFYIPAKSRSARRQWAKIADQWLQAECSTGCVGIAYLEDGVVYAGFQSELEGSAFRMACTEF